MIGSDDIEQTADSAPDLGGDDLRAQLESALVGEPDTGPSTDSATTVPDDGEPAAATPSSDAQGDGDSPPASWSKTAKQDWYALPPAARAEVQRREREIQSALSQSAESRKFAEALKPWTEQIAAAGMEPAGYLGNLLAWNQALRVQPAQAIATLSEQFLGDASSARAVVKALSQRFGLDEWDTMGEEPRERGPSPQIVQLEQRLRQQELQAAQREWSDFREAKTPDGKALHPYAEDCKAEMADAIRANPQLSFAEAYERAKWINPGVRAKILQAEAQQRAGESRRTADKARGMSLPRGRGGDGGMPSRDDLRAELREQLARTGARVSE